IPVHLSLFLRKTKALLEIEMLAPRPPRQILFFTLFVMVLVFASGFWVGRRFPAHHYTAFSMGEFPLLIDSTTGKVCVPETKKPTTLTNLFDTCSN
ncbi:MAG: hypothetical protein WB949_10750, partial [Candidatus Acidiferrales bacterium]